MIGPFIVRLKANHEFVGIFWAENEKQLFWLIDECTDPSACEYAELDIAGGLYSPKSGAGNTPPDDDSPINWFNNREPAYTEGLFSAITKTAYGPVKAEEGP